MDLENKPLYSLLPWVISVVVSLLFALLLRNELAHQEKDWEEYLHTQQEADESARNISQQHLLQQASGYVQLIAQDKDVRSLVRRAAVIYEQEARNDNAEKIIAIRAELQKALGLYWEQITPLGVRELNVHFAAQDTAFLRMNSTARFGDSLTQTSPLLVTAIKKGEITKGMEVGHYGANYRAFFPVTASDSSIEIVAAVEIGVGLLPTQDHQGHKGQAVLISSALTNQFLWDRVQQEIISNSKKRHGPWYIESYNDPIVKSWQQSGTFDQISLERLSPTVIQDQGKTFMFSVVPLEGFSLPQVLTVSPQIALLTWNDITKERNAYTKHHTRTIKKFIAS